MADCNHPMVNVTGGENICFMCKEHVPMCVVCDAMEWQHKDGRLGHAFVGEQNDLICDSCGPFKTGQEVMGHPLHEGDRCYYCNGTIKKKVSRT